MRVALVLIGMLAAGTSALADPRILDQRLAGEMIAIDTHGQAICATREALRDYLLATIRHERLVPTMRNADCSIAPYGTRVTVLEDLPPFGSRLHMVRVAAATPLQRVEGYTYNVGLYDAGRFKDPNPQGDVFPKVP